MLTDRLSSRLRSLKVTSRPYGNWLLNRPHSYLSKCGWYDSFRRHMPIDSRLEPIPWFTYPAIAFLQDRIDKSFDVFEYGSGNSTLWWSTKVNSVISCEHDRSWYNLMEPQLPNSVTYLCNDESSEQKYSDTISDYERQFDIIVLDGRDRVACARNCIGALKNEGVLVWDNSEREKYAIGLEFLRDNGFRRLDFHGMGPINAYGWLTTILYRPNNCLEI